MTHQAILRRNQGGGEGHKSVHNLACVLAKMNGDGARDQQHVAAVMYLKGAVDAPRKIVSPRLHRLLPFLQQEKIGNTHTHIHRRCVHRPAFVNERIHRIDSMFVNGFLVKDGNAVDL